MSFARSFKRAQSSKQIDWRSALRSNQMQQRKNGRSFTLRTWNTNLLEHCRKPSPWPTTFPFHVGSFGIHSIVQSFLCSRFVKSNSRESKQSGQSAAETTCHPSYHHAGRLVYTICLPTTCPRRLAPDRWAANYWSQYLSQWHPDTLGPLILSSLFSMTSS